VSCKHWCHRQRRRTAVTRDASVHTDIHTHRQTTSVNDEQQALSSATTHADNPHSLPPHATLLSIKSTDPSPVSLLEQTDGRTEA